jgi:cob(I)alamin adenosyltransferase
MVILNKIYTRTGDDGTTALGTSERVPKYALRVAAYGTTDETNAAIGVARLHLTLEPAVDAMLARIRTTFSISEPTFACPIAAPSPTTSHPSRRRTSSGLRTKSTR